MVCLLVLPYFHHLLTWAQVLLEGCKSPHPYENDIPFAASLRVSISLVTPLRSSNNSPSPLLPSSSLPPSFAIGGFSADPVSRGIQSLVVVEDRFVVVVKLVTFQLEIQQDKVGLALVTVFAVGACIITFLEVLRTDRRKPRLP